MNREQRGRWVAGLLLGAWLLVVAWQVTEHRRVVEAGRSDLRNRSREIARTLSAVTRALRFRGAVFQERLDPVLNELAGAHPNALVRTTQLLAIGLVNNDGDTVAAAGETNLISRESVGESERWSDENVVFVLPVEGASVNPEGVTNNPTVVLPSSPRNFTNGLPRNGRDGPRREPPPDDGTNNAGLSPASSPPPPTNAVGEMESPPPPPDDNGHPPGGDRQRGGNRRPPWMRGMSDADFKALIAKRELHGLVLVMSTENYRALCLHDLWLRYMIGFFAGIAALGAGLSWRNTARTAELQIRLVRASEQNSHLKELNLAAAGLAHETRNPLNIIRGQAQLLARLPDTTAEIRAQAKTIVDQTDRVTAQLTEFINYSRPREVHRAKVTLAAVGNEVVRTLGFDIEEKKLQVEVTGEALAVEADEQLLRQVLFNLLLNAVQAANEGGRIQLLVQRAPNQSAVFEIRDDGPGVPPENRQAIFKPYFTTHQKGTGLGLAVVQQIVHAHGWDIVCLANEPRGAVFRITHLKIVA
ncbi:MAG: ATP-binding protein [Verrucomicrobiae bacterium]|nr:ATP-binding protein [Verrucomicrobiae bacterium]